MFELNLRPRVLRGALHCFWVIVMRDTVVARYLSTMAICLSVLGREQEFDRLAMALRALWIRPTSFLVLEVRIDLPLYKHRLINELICSEDALLIRRKTRHVRFTNQASINSRDLNRPCSYAADFLR